MEDGIYSALFGQPKQPIPRLLFHYTGADGARGILECQSLWLSALQAPTIHPSTDLGSTFLRRKPSLLLPAWDWAKPGRSSTSCTLRLSQDRARSRAGLNPFTISFCAEEDLLSQWREYGRDGSGVQIGFDLRDWDSNFLATPENNHWQLAKVLYDEREQHERARFVLSVLQHATEVYCSFGSSPRLDFVKNGIAAVYHTIVSCSAATLKHPGFREESEWRLIAHPRLHQSAPHNFQVLDRSSGYGTNNYIVLEPPLGGRLPVRSVKFGPTASDAVGRDLGQLAKARCPEIQLSRSSLPMRPRAPSPARCARADCPNSPHNDPQ